VKLYTTQLIASMVLLLCVQCAQATLTCNTLVSAGFTTANAPTGIFPNVTQGTVTFNCSRTSASDATSVLLKANYGSNATGSNNRARLGTQYIRYEAYKVSACAVSNTIWTGNSTATSIPVTLQSQTGSFSYEVSFWGCITLANQSVPAGVYTDTFTMTITKANGSSSYATGTAAVSIRNPATCSITTPPGDVVFNYTAFGATANAGTTFVANCTQWLPYTMSLNASSGVVSGLNYTLQINNQTAIPTSPLSSRGTGAGQTHTINGNMPAGQAGTCSGATCQGTQAHTLTISY
jgi:spore coat protein U-like protein